MKNFRLYIFTLLALSLVWFGFDDGKKKISKESDYSWIKEGDVVFQDMAGEFGEAIKLATHSKYSHCGMVLKKDGKLFVYEAVGPVKYTPLKEWIKQGAKKQFKVKRPGKTVVINTSIVEKMKKNAEKYTGKAYDHVFGWSDEKIYCSELVWKMYKDALGIELSAPKKLKEFDLTHPAVKKQLEMRYGKNIPYDESVVAPQDLLDSKLLKDVEG